MDRWLVHNEVLSPNWNERRLPVWMVVLHYTGMPTAEEALERLTDAAAEVSAHYLIDEEGKVTRLVPEDKRAWHAGQAYWRGITDVNSASVGIELVNPGHEWGYRPFPQAQMEALIPLLADIVKRHKIPYANVVGHSDVAPARKDDPGELFDWPLLARYKWPRHIEFWASLPTSAYGKLVKKDIRALYLQRQQELPAEAPLQAAPKA